jgi:glyoxylase-like metal-dependent hydrolase (beta-lactamase superfamily II)
MRLVLVVAAISSALALSSTGVPAQSARSAALDQNGPVLRTGDPYMRGYTDDDFPRVRKLADGAYSYEQLRSAGDERFTTVSFIVVTSVGVLVADGQGNLAETERLLAEIKKITPQPVTHVVIGSDHGDHTGGNRAFPAGVKYFVHPTSQATLAIPGAEIVADQKTIRLGETEIQIRFLGRAHTGGDLSVYLPTPRILFMSEAYLNRIFPAMRSAYPSEWAATIEKAQAIDADIYVPGHGFVDSPAVLKEELETFRRALVQVIAEARRLREAGLDAEKAAVQARFGNLEHWTLRSSQGATAIKRVFLELDGKLK